MSDSIHKIRIVVQIITVLFVLAGVVTITWGIATPSWQTVFIPELSERHQHGLWLDCIDNTRQLTYSCNYKFWQDTINSGFVQNNRLFNNFGSAQPRRILPQELQHTYQKWHKTALILFSVGVSLALIGLFVSFCSLWHRIPSLIWAILQFIATILCLAGIIEFFINSSTNEFRSVSGLITTNEQWLGYSFWLAVAGCICFGIAAFLSILTTVLIFRRHIRTNRYITSAEPKDLDRLSYTYGQVTV